MFVKQTREETKVSGGSLSDNDDSNDVMKMMEMLTTTEIITKS